MRTWFGVGGAVFVGTVVVLVILISGRDTAQQTRMTFQDGGIVKEDTNSTEYTLWRPDESELEHTTSFGKDWEGKVIQDKTIAEKYKKPVTETPTQGAQKTTQEKREPIEYVNVGDMWKSNKKIELTDWEKEPQEDAVKKTIRAFGNAVGTKIQAFTISHGTQNTKLGAFATERTNDGRAYVESLAADYDTLAKDIELIDSPAAFSEEHKGLVAGYKSIADGLRVLKRSTDDTSTYEYMQTYNSHVEEFATRFISFALLFKAQGIEFKENEPGGIFTPPVTQQQ